MEFPTYKLSINIYGRGDALLGDGPSHMSITISDPSSSTCEMHHIRNPTEDPVFIYESRTQPLDDDDPVLRGRCEIASSLSAAQRQEAVSLITAFGNDEANIPEFGVGNCQDWVADAVGVLERAGLVSIGEARFWKGMINKSAQQIKDECLRKSRKWKDGPAEMTFEGEPDARFDDTEKMPVGKLAQNEMFQQRMQSLLGPREAPGEKPFYVSSPFFSRLNETDD